MSQQSQPILDIVETIFTAAGVPPGDAHDRVRQLSGEYRQLLNGGPDIDYNKPSVRQAYVYMYVAANTLCLAKVLTDLKDQKLLVGLNQDQLDVCCVGGGPGSDVLGVLKFLQDEFEQADRPATVFFQMLDKCDLWSDTWLKLLQRVGAGIGTAYVAMDFLEEKDLSKMEAKSLDTVKLFTFVRFLSHVAGDGDRRLVLLEHLGIMMEKAEDNAYFLIVDNFNPTKKPDRLTSFFGDLAKQHGIKKVFSHNKYPVEVVVNIPEAAEEWKELTKFSPLKHQPYVLVELWQKCMHP